MLVSNEYVNTSAKESPGKLFSNSHEHAVGPWSETCEFRSLKEKFSFRDVTTYASCDTVNGIWNLIVPLPTPLIFFNASVKLLNAAACRQTD